MSRIARRLRARRGPIAMIASGVLLIAPMAGKAVSDTGSATPLGGYTLFANGNGAQVVLDNPAGLAGSHPVGYVSVPEASATVETGPLGHGLATVLWPGAAVGNLGSLSYQLPIPPQLQQYLKNTNDPVKAQTNVPGGPADATYPTGGGGPVVMSSHADDKTIDSQASVVGLATGGQIQVGSIHGHGKTQLTDTAATATGTSSLTGIDILGGLIHIDKVSSTATATSDGNKAKGSGSTIVAGVTVAGTPATIDNNGVHLAQSHIPLNGALVPTTAAINQVLGALDLKADLLPTTNTPNGAQVNVIAGALTLTYNVPANISQLLTTVLHNIPQIPNVFQDATVTLALGGATADANASPGFLAGPEPSIEPSSGPAAIAPGVSSAVAGSPAAAASPFASRGSGLAVTAPQLAGRATPSGGGFSSSPLGLFTGLNPGLIVMALVGAVLSSVGLKRLGTGALDPPTGIGCPLKEPT